MRILLVAPDVAHGGDVRHIEAGQSYSAIDAVPEIRSITDMHRVSVLNGYVTAQDVFRACREQRDIIHFATHSDEEAIQLSGGETLSAEDLRKLVGLSHCRLVFFNSCRSARLAAYVVAHGAPYAIATTVDLPDRDAWKAALAFYDHCQAQMAQLHDPLLVDLAAAFRAAVNGDGTYMMLSSIQRQAELTALMTQMHEWRESQTQETHVWREQQKRMLRLLIIQAAAGWILLVIMLALFIPHIWGG